jgi:hypothetical protein
MVWRKLAVVVLGGLARLLDSLSGGLDEALRRVMGREEAAGPGLSAGPPESPPSHWPDPARSEPPEHWLKLVRDLSRQSLDPPQEFSEDGGTTADGGARERDSRPGPGVSSSSSRTETRRAQPRVHGMRDAPREPIEPRPLLADEHAAAPPRAEGAGTPRASTPRPRFLPGKKVAGVARTEPKPASPREIRTGSRAAGRPTRRTEPDHPQADPAAAQRQRPAPEGRADASRLEVDRARGHEGDVPVSSRDAALPGRPPQRGRLPLPPRSPANPPRRSVPESRRRVPDSALPLDRPAPDITRTRGQEAPIDRPEPPTREPVHRREAPAGHTMSPGRPAHAAVRPPSSRRPAGTTQPVPRVAEPPPWAPVPQSRWPETAWGFTLRDDPWPLLPETPDVSLAMDERLCHEELDRRHETGGRRRERWNG